MKVVRVEAVEIDRAPRAFADCSKRQFAEPSDFVERGGDFVSPGTVNQ